MQNEDPEEISWVSNKGMSYRIRSIWQHVISEQEDYIQPDLLTFNPLVNL